MFNPKVLGGLALGLVGQLMFAGCSSPELQDLLQSNGVAIANDPPISEFAPGAHQYGADGAITQEQLGTLKNLAWPQTYEAMIGTFGYPSHRTETADYYAIEATSSHWAVVKYDGKTAINYLIEEKN